MSAPGRRTGLRRFMAQWVALGSMVRKELVQTFRDRRMVFMMVAVPLLQLTIFGYAVDMDVTHVPLVVQDEDQSAASRKFIEEVLAGETFEDAGRVEKAREAVSRLVEGRASVALVIPRSFAGMESGRRSGAVQVLVDGGQSVTAVVAANALAQMVALRSIQIVQEVVTERFSAMAMNQEGQGLDADGQAPSASFAPFRPPTFHFRPRVFYNPTLESRIFMVPGVAASLLMILTILITSMGVVRERESGTLEQVLVSPLSPTVLLLGKTLPYLLIGFMDLLLVIVAAVWLFDIPFRGPVLVILTGGILYLGSTLALGLTVSTISSTQQQAVLGGLFVLMPAIVLSGFLAPVDNMPVWMQDLTLLNPMRHFVEILRACMLKGAGWEDLAPQIVALASLGALLMGIASMRFSKQVQ